VLQGGLIKSKEHTLQQPQYNTYMSTILALDLDD